MSKMNWAAAARKDRRGPVDWSSRAVVLTSVKEVRQGDRAQTAPVLRQPVTVRPIACTVCGLQHPGEC